MWTWHCRIDPKSFQSDPKQTCCILAKNKQSGDCCMGWSKTRSDLCSEETILAQRVWSGFYRIWRLCPVEHAVRAQMDLRSTIWGVEQRCNPSRSFRFQRLNPEANQVLLNHHSITQSWNVLECSDYMLGMRCNQETSHALNFSQAAATVPAPSEHWFRKVQNPSLCAQQMGRLGRKQLVERSNHLCSSRSQLKIFIKVKSFNAPHQCGNVKFASSTSTHVSTTISVR